MTEARVSDALVRRLWLRRSLSRAEAAARAGCSQSCLRRRAKALGLPSRHHAVGDDAIRAVWGDESLRREEMEARLGLAQSCIWKRAKAMGLPPRKRHRKGYPVFDRALFRRMWLAGVSAAEIGREIGRHRTVVNDIAATMGFAPRPHGSARTPLEDFRADELRRAMARTAAAEQAAMKARGMMIAPGIGGREAA
jgi:hypothetical protein